MDKAYEEAVNELIPVASAIADKKVEKLGTFSELREGADGKLYNYSFWTEFFHKEMKRLTYNAGLRGC